MHRGWSRGGWNEHWSVLPVSCDLAHGNIIPNISVSACCRLLVRVTCFPKAERRKRNNAVTPCWILHGEHVVSAFNNNVGCSTSYTVFIECYIIKRRAIHNLYLIRGMEDELNFPWGFCQKGESHEKCRISYVLIHLHIQSICSLSAALKWKETDTLSILQK